MRNRSVSPKETNDRVNGEITLHFGIWVEEEFFCKGQVSGFGFLGQIFTSEFPQKQSHTPEVF